MRDIHNLCEYYWMTQLSAEWIIIGIAMRSRVTIDGVWIGDWNY
jgi:hypothetical protein